MATDHTLLFGSGLQTQVEFNFASGPIQGRPSKNLISPAMTIRSTGQPIWTVYPLTIVIVFLLPNDHLGPNNPGGLYERIDPYARYAPNPDAASPAVVVDPAFAFVPWNSPNVADYNIYQLHIGSFAGLNDPLSAQVVNRVATFRQLVSALDNKLDYIRDLNFNAVQFLPTSPYPTATGEGYAPENFFAPENAFGSPGDLRFLVDQCHARGLAVIFDVVYNHVVASDADDRLLCFDGNVENNNRGIYFSTFDNFGPVPNFDKSAVRDFFVDNARMLFREYNMAVDLS